MSAWTSYRSTWKRVLDFVGALALLIILSPIIAMAWLAVSLSSSGRAIFPQDRVGMNSALFRCYKFRSMYVDHDHLVDMAKIEEDKKKGILYKPKDDPRITPVGRFIRATSIDELPQLWNVVRGEMSLVGPRPLVPHMLAPFPESREKRGKVRPGCTGLWQVSARNRNNSVQDMDKYDLEYIDSYCFWVDVRILLKTPFKLMDGAH